MANAAKWEPNGPQPAARGEERSSFVPVLNLTAFDSDSHRRQIMAASAAGALALSAGTALGWFFAIFSDWRENLAGITSFEMSWIQSLLFLGAAVGTIPGVLLSDRLGRRKTMLLIAMLYVIGWIFIIPRYAAVMCIGRFLQGLSAGASVTVVPGYAGEIAEENLGKTLRSLMVKLIIIGFLLEYFVGIFIPYLALAILSMLIPIAYIIAFNFIPESPVYLLTQGRPEEARVALNWLHQTTPELVQQELERLQTVVRELTSTWDELVGTPDNRVSLLKLLGLIVGQQMSGICSEFHASRHIFRELNSSIGLVVVAFATWGIIFSAPYFKNKLEGRFGPKKLLFYSAVVMTASQVLVAIYFSAGVFALIFLAIVGVITYYGAFFVGFGPIPWELMRDVFPPKLWSKASSSMLTILWFVIFFISQAFWDAGYMVEFWVFALCSAIAAVYVHFMFPDTTPQPAHPFEDVDNVLSQI